MILVRNLSKYFQQTAAVMDVSFEVKEGETLVLLGTSGSGKTSTLRMINRLIEPSAGEIFIKGKNTLEQPLEVLRRSIGYVLQSNGLFLITQWLKTLELYLSYLDGINNQSSPERSNSL
jgi:osmoprotectant transport system ATP-binding protein